VKNLRIATLNATPAPFDPAKGEAGLPTRFKVLGWGENQTVKGRIVVNTKTLSTLPAYQKSHNWDKRVALDFDHSTVPESPTYRPDAPVAGYGPIEVVDGDGLYMQMLSWTDDGKRLAGGGHFADLSATVILNEHDEVIGVHSVALCRNGAAPGMVFLSSWSPESTKPPQTAEDLFNALKSALGAAHDATPTQVLQQLSDTLAMPTETKPTDKPAQQEPAAAKAEDATAIKTLSAGIDKLTTLVEGQVETIKTLSSKLDAVEKANDERERAVILSSAAGEGKEVPEVAKTLPIEQLKTLCSQLPVTIPVERRTPLHSTPPAAAPVMDDISKLTGVSADDRKKYGGN
jgi:phage I-like protein